MSNSKRDGNGKEKFFVAVTKSCGTAVESSEKAVREEIAQRGVTKKNVAVFRCCFNGTNTSKELIYKRKRTFTLMARHRTVLKNACFDFLEDRMGT